MPELEDGGSLPTLPTTHCEGQPAVLAGHPTALKFAHEDNWPDTHAVAELPPVLCLLPMELHLGVLTERPGCGLRQRARSLNLSATFP